MYHLDYMFCVFCFLLLVGQLDLAVFRWRHKPSLDYPNQSMDLMIQHGGVETLQ